MKKFYVAILIIMVTYFSLPVNANSFNYNNIEVKLAPMDVVVQDDEDIYIGTTYDENSKDGYEIMTDSNGNKYKYRTRYIKRNSTDLTLYQSQYIFSLYKGQTKSVTESYTATRSSSVNWSSSTTSSTSFQLAQQGINSSMSTTLSTNNAESSTYSITKGTVYSFPENAPVDVGYCNLYAGFCHDIYDIVADYVPYKTYDKKTKVLFKSITTLPFIPDDPIYEFDIIVTLEDGREFKYHAICPEHHYHEDYDKIPEIKWALREYADGYKHEVISAYDFNSRAVFQGTVTRPISYEKYVYVY
ncbi:hypothetical protein AN1V17_21180 [Vallitalea sediminicola]